MSDELKMVFDIIQSRLLHLDKKLDSLNGFRWKTIGIAIGASSVFSVVAAILTVFLKGG